MEIDSHWKFRPGYANNSLLFVSENSLRTKLCKERTLRTVNSYLLGNRLTTTRSELPKAGPTLTDSFFANTDRHKSGLHCWDSDERRETVEYDVNIAPLQTMQDKADYLTDSESDNEDEYEIEPVSMKKVRKILYTDKDNDESNEKGKETQVELLVDRKRLEQSANYTKIRQNKQNAVTER